MTVSEKILAGLSAVCLLYLALQSLLITMNFAGAIYGGDIAAFAVIFLGILTTAVCLVTSYRQILRPRPVLVLSALGLQIIFTTLFFTLTYALFQNEEVASFYNAIRDAALVENIEASPGITADDYFPSIDESLSASAFFRTYATIFALMAIPVVRSVVYPRLSS